VTDSGSLAPRPPVLLLHGLAGSGEVWMRCLPLIAQSGTARAIAPDMPGFGQSPGPPSALDIEGLADWSVRLLDALSVGRADVAGHSMGCQVALALADRHPGRVGALVLAGPTMGRRTVPVWRHLAGMVLGAHREPLAYKVLAARMFWRMGLCRYLATVGRMMDDDAVGPASRVAAACLVVRGSRDAIIPEGAARRLAAALPRGSFAPIEGGAHVVPFNNAGEFARLALGFWEEQAVRRTVSGVTSHDAM
jgi:pimeloyl-ACP methyl ester carboxylesterase